MNYSRLRTYGSKVTLARYWVTTFLAFSPWNCFAMEPNLASLITERLSYMRDVAAYKWLHKLPITDIARERFVINAGVIAALRHGITRTSSERFYRSQIEAAKAVQRCWHERWREEEEAPPSTNLNQVIRPILIELGDKISGQLINAPPDTIEFNKLVQVECLTSDAKQKILESTKEIRFYSSRFDQIMDSKILRVGTTGDYAPFSLSSNGLDFSGIDIDLAHELARHLNARVTFVQTSWPNLMSDFASGKFDIGMSGISITEQRKQEALFSRPYHIGGKTPIALCTRVDSFQSVEDIDVPEIRVAVNPGGTNEIFVDNNLMQAKKVVLEDNRGIFQYLVKGQADLMITDQIEVDFQSALHPELCGLATRTTFTYQEKAYLIPPEQELLTAVNSWLKQAQQSGTLRAVFDSKL